MQRSLCFLSAPEGAQAKNQSEKILFRIIEISPRVDRVNADLIMTEGELSKKLFLLS